jgi:hypothetical protein
MSEAGMYWQYRPDWMAWWLMIPANTAESQLGFGPFNNEFEIQMASEVHGVPFTGDIDYMAAPICPRRKNTPVSEHPKPADNAHPMDEKH